jgi:protein Tex
MDPAIVRHIVQEVALPESSVTATLALLEAGATAPFVARYRKEASGGLDESQVRAIQDRLIHYRELEERRAQLVKFLNEQGKLTDELRQQIEGKWDRYEIEDLHHRFRPRVKTRANEAIAKGLEPLADYIWSQDPDAWSLEEHADVFIDAAKGVADRQQALQGAAEIVADWIAENFELRKALREMLWREGVVVSTVVPAKAGLKTKYNMYYDRREPVSSIPSHRVLAIRRGTKEGVLTSSIQCDSAKALALTTGLLIKDPESTFAPILGLAARDSYSRILRPLIETEVRAQLKERADREAIRVFQENLENLLLSPPAGRVAVIGVDAGKGEECRLAAVDEHGKFLEEVVVYPKPPKSDLEGTKTSFLDLVRKHNAGAVAIGNGAAAHDIERILRQILADEKIDTVMVTTVNDAGVVVYSSSRAGREEFPDLTPATRAAISTARRLQDPLAELVKVDPKLIGVGQYQHDVDQKELHRRLIRTVQSCANRVGADLNAADFSLLRYISGMNDRLARRVVAHRTASGPFPARAAILSVPGFEETVYQQAAAFLRVPNSDSFLDRSWIHPEHYHLVEKMAASLNVAVNDLFGNGDLVSSLKLEDFANSNAGLQTLEFIRSELLAAGKDPRGTFAPPRYHADVVDISDLKEGMILEGAVTNVTNFGAFVDIGIHQDGLVHLSQMSNRFIRDPREVVKVGDIVQVKVISVEVETKRIGLSMKALLPVIPRRGKKPRRPQSRTAQPAQPTDPVASSDVSVPAETGAAQAEDAKASPTGRDPRAQRRRRPPHLRGGGRPRRRDARPVATEAAAVKNDVQAGKAAAAPQVPEAEPVPAAPEPTLQEKIAILQIKFRGIN